jgi:RNase adapter protein RapZ
MKITDILPKRTSNVRLSGTSPSFDSLIIVAGISGAGRSSTLRLLGDVGYYTIDNLPTVLFPTFLSESGETVPKYQFTGLILDTDCESKVTQLVNSIKHLQKNNIPLKILFLDSDTSVLLRRYSETRRPHPVFDPHIDSSLENTIERERHLLATIKALADKIIDTTKFNVNDLRRDIWKFVQDLHSHPETSLFVTIETFGFKHGTPRNCDVQMDVRFLPNPFWVHELREKNGLDPEVSNYVFNSNDYQQFIEKYLDLLNLLLPLYTKEGKSYLTIGIGCTGGKHRSVAIGEAIASRLCSPGVLINVSHRDIDKK